MCPPDPSRQARGLGTRQARGSAPHRPPPPLSYGFQGKPESPNSGNTTLKCFLSHIIEVPLPNTPKSFPPCFPPRPGQRSLGAGSHQFPADGPTRASIYTESALKHGHTSPTRAEEPPPRAVPSGPVAAARRVRAGKAAP